MFKKVLSTEKIEKELESIDKDAEDLQNRTKGRPVHTFFHVVLSAHPPFPNDKHSGAYPRRGPGPPRIGEEVPEDGTEDTRFQDSPPARMQPPRPGRGP